MKRKVLLFLLSSLFSLSAYFFIIPSAFADTLVYSSSSFSYSCSQGTPSAYSNLGYINSIPQNGTTTLEGNMGYSGYSAGIISDLNVYSDSGYTNLIASYVKTGTSTIYYWGLSSPTSSELIYGYSPSIPSGYWQLYNQCGASGISDYSYITGLNIYQSSLSPSVSFVFPSSTYQITANFPLWDIQVNNLPQGATGTISVYYGASTSTLTYFGGSTYTIGTGSGFETEISNTGNLWYPPLTDPANWYAQAVMTIGSSSYTSPSVYFGISPNASGSPYSVGGGITSSTIQNPITSCGQTPPSFFGTTSTLPYFYITSPIPDIQNGICQSMVFLFIPNTDEISNEGLLLNDIYTSIENKPPFGYFTTVKDDMLLIGESTSTPSGTIITSSSIAAFSIVYDPIDSGLADIVYIFFVLWLIYRITHFHF